MQARGLPDNAYNTTNLPRLKLTPSCSRCRTKKLKCRYADGNTVCCIICTDKGLGNQCHRDVRMSRGKRIKLDEGQSIASRPEVAVDRPTDPSELENNNRKARIASLRNELEELESVERDRGDPFTPDSSDHYRRSSSFNDGQSWSAGEATLARDTPKQTQTEKIALRLEDYVANGTKAGQSGSSASGLPRDVAQEKWQKAATINERLSLLRAAKECPIASDELVVRELVSVFLYRVNHLVGHVIYSPGYQRAVEAFLSMSMEECVMSKAFVDPCCLATMMLVLCLGYEFHPHHPPPGRAASPGFLAVQKIRQGAIDPTVHWYAIARQSFAVEDSYHLPSIPALQAACLFLARGKESKGWMRMLHQVAISSARSFGLHRLGQAKAESWMQVDDFIRLECGVRIWNYLTMRDWSLANDQDSLTVIHPDQMSTRRPLNLDDEDIEAGLAESKTDLDWTSMSFVIAQIELAELIRDSARTTQHRTLLMQRADDYLRRLPHYFQWESQANSPGLVAVQRWLLHQQVFDLQLRLWRLDLAAPEGRQHCLDLAEKVIDHQARIRAICPVIDNLQVNFFHLFGACMVIILDLIHRNRGVNRLEQNERFAARSKITHALDLFRGEAKHGRAIRLLRIMLDYEEECHTSSRNITPDDSLSMLAERMLSEMQSSDKGGQYQTERQKEIWPSFLSYPRIPDHTVLPAVGAWSQLRREWSNSSEIGRNAAGSYDGDMPASATTLHSSQSGSDPNTPVSTHQIFDRALGVAHDPFELHYKTTAPGPHIHTLPAQDSSWPSYLSGKPNIFNPIQSDLIASAPYLER